MGRTQTHNPEDTADEPGHTVAWAQNQAETPGIGQDTDTGRQAGTHQEPHTERQMSTCIPLTDTKVPSDADTQSDWGTHRPTRMRMLGELGDGRAHRHGLSCRPDVPAKTGTPTPPPGAEPR